MSEPAPLVSVVIPAYNRGWCIERAVGSVLAQTEPRVEAIVADDGSTDDTAARVRALRDPRVRYEPLPENRGVIAARDHGIQRARGTWVLLLDSDDELLPTCVERFLAAAARIRDKPRVRILFADYLDTGTNRVKSTLGGDREEGRERLLSYDELVSTPFFGDLLPMVRRDLFEEVPYRMSQRRVMQIVWYRLYRRSDVFYLGETLALCHTQGGDRITRNRTRDAQLWVDGLRQFLGEFGPDVSRLAPRLYATHLRILATAEVAAGRRVDAIRSSLRALRADPREWKAAAVMATTVLPRELAARLLFK